MLGALMEGYALGLKQREESEQRQLGIKKQKLELEQEETKRAYQQELKEAIAQLNKEHDDARALVEQSENGITVDSGALEQARKKVSPYSLYSSRSAAILGLRRKYGYATEEDEFKAFERGRQLEQVGVMQALQTFQTTGDSERAINIMRERGLNIPAGSQFKMIEDPTTKMAMPAIYDPKGQKLADASGILMSYVDSGTYLKMFSQAKEGALGRASAEGIAKGRNETTIGAALISERAAGRRASETSGRKVPEQLEEIYKNKLSGLGTLEKTKQKEFSDYYSQVKTATENLMNRVPEYAGRPNAAWNEATKFLKGKGIVEPILN